MVCKDCRRKIPDNSIYCNWCGVKQLRERKRRDEIKVPTPTELPSGNWTIYLRAEGQSITEPTRELCLARARAVRAGFLAERAAAKSSGLTLEQAIDRFVDVNKLALSPSTIRGYSYIKKGRFAAKMQRPLSETEGWQRVIDADAARLAPKTVHNAWGLVAEVMVENGVTPPRVRLPQKTMRELPWLTYAEILKFIDAVKGSRCETAALFALHSLRQSEILALTWDSIDLTARRITVAGARVRGENGKYVSKSSTKNISSTRTVKIMIPELVDALEDLRRNGLPPVLSQSGGMTESINNVCQKAGLPKVGTHGLRRSFASLAFHLGMSELEVMQLGGWSDHNTLHKIYVRLAQEDRLNAENRMESWYKTRGAAAGEGSTEA